MSMAHFCSQFYWRRKRLFFKRRMCMNICSWTNCCVLIYFMSITFLQCVARSSPVSFFMRFHCLVKFVFMRINVENRSSKMENFWDTWNWLNEWMNVDCLYFKTKMKSKVIKFWNFSHFCLFSFLFSWQFIVIKLVDLWTMKNHDAEISGRNATVIQF